jgi:hypothetical protein
MFYDVTVIKIVNFATVFALCALAVVNVIYLNVFYLVSLLGLSVNWCRIVSCFVKR